MPDPFPRAELMRSLGRLVRGLSALFWGLPFTLLVSAQKEIFNWFRPHGVMLPILANGLLVYGLIQLSYFQRQERVWTSALERGKLLGIINTGLAPFLYFRAKVPANPFFSEMVFVLVLTGILFLFNLNHVLNRLASMLPDQTLRDETRLFSQLNRFLLIIVVGMLLAYHAVSSLDLPVVIIHFLTMLNHARSWLLIFLVLLPVAMTMTLIWKIKDVILASVFNESVSGDPGSEA